MSLASQCTLLWIPLWTTLCAARRVSPTACPKRSASALAPIFGQRIGSLDPARRNLVPQLLLVLMLRLSPATHHRWTGNEQRTTQWPTTLWLGGRRQLLAAGQLLGLPRFRGIPEGVGGQVQPRPAAVVELVQVPGQALVEVVVFGDGADRPFDARRAVHAERDRPHLPGIPLRGVVPALHVPHLPRTG